jgi:hypothetical protein
MPRKENSILNVIAATVKHFPGLTGAELGVRLGIPSAYRRLSEIARLGLVEKQGTKICDVSGKTAVTWYPCDKPAEVDRGKLTPGQEIKRLKARIEFLEQECTRLSHRLSHAIENPSEP